MKQKIKNKYTEHKETIHNFTWRSLQIFGKQGITFLIFILCAKLLTPYDFGIYNYVLAIVFFLIIFGDFGISTATSKYVAEYNVTDKEKLKLVLFNSGIIILALTVIISILTLLIGPWYLKDKYNYVLYLLPLIFLAPMTSLYDGIYRGLKKFKILAIISILIGVISIPMVYFLISKYGLIGALIAQNIFYFVLFIGLALGYRDFKFKWNKDVMGEVGKYSIIMGVAGLGYFIFTRINILILGYFGYIIEVGYYELINKLMIILLVPINLLSQVISPEITSAYYKKDYVKIIKDFKRYMVISIFTGGLLILFVFISYPILVTFLPSYNTPLLMNSMFLLLPLLISQSVSSISSVGFCVSTGHAKLNMYFLLIFGILNIFLSIILIRNFGYIGIIYSTLIIKFFTDILFTLIYIVILKKDMSENKKS